MKKQALRKETKNNLNAADVIKYMDIKSAQRMERHAINVER